MSEPEIPPFDGDVLNILKGARGEPALPEGVRERMRTRLGTCLDPPKPAKPDVREAASRWSRLVRGGGLLVAGGVIGAAAHATLAPPRVETKLVERIVASATAQLAPVDDSIAPEMPVSALPTAVPPPRKIATAPATDDGGGSDETLARERSLVEVARSALARGDSAGALAAADQHAHAFPNGQLTEECEAVAIQALVQSGRNDDARARAAVFRRRFPHGIFLRVVDAALASISP